LELVKRSMPGMPLAHLVAPPSAISPRADTNYFTLAQETVCWDQVVKTRELGVYLPACGHAILASGGLGSFEHRIANGRYPHPILHISHRQMGQQST
jgi:hypothetical protein